MEKVERETYVRMPEEDRSTEDTEQMVGSLKKSMNGTQDALNLFRRDYVRLFLTDSFVAGRSSYATFMPSDLDSRGLVHKDDFAVIGDKEALQKLDGILRSKHTVEWTAKIGPEEGDDKEDAFLDRVIRYCHADS